ncbi:MAG: hypothetical protein ACK4TP_14595 [Hyphomicrobium sp.]|jgi:hypothetical protein
MGEAIVMVHVRFAPDGTVTEIGERPTGKTPQQWFNLLSEEIKSHYQPLSGGRGVFRVTRAKIESLKGNASTGAPSP